MTIYTLEQLKQASLEWPKEVREQLDDNNILEQMIKEVECDLIRLSWKKVDFGLTNLTKFTQAATVSAMTVSSRLGISYGIDNDLERHERLRKYLLENGTWPTAPVVVITTTGYRIIDGFHRVVQLIDIHNILQIVMHIEPVRQQILYDEFQNHNYVKQLNDTHKVWLGEASE